MARTNTAADGPMLKHDDLLEKMRTRRFDNALRSTQPRAVRVLSAGAGPGAEAGAAAALRSIHTVTALWRF